MFDHPPLSLISGHLPRRPKDILYRATVTENGAHRSLIARRE